MEHVLAYLNHLCNDDNKISTIIGYTVHPSQPRFTLLLSIHPLTFEGQAAVGWRHAQCVCEGTHAGCVVTLLWCDGRVRPERPQSTTQWRVFVSPHPPSVLSQSVPGVHLLRVWFSSQFQLRRFRVESLLSRCVSHVICVDSTVPGDHSHVAVVRLCCLHVFEAVTFDSLLAGRSEELCCAIRQAGLVPS